MPYVQTQPTQPPRMAWWREFRATLGQTINQLAWSILILSLVGLSLVALAVDGLTGYLGGYLGPSLYAAQADRLYPAYDIRMSSVDGQTLGVYGQDESRREPVNEVPATFGDLLVAFEDARFYEHNGVDRIRLMGALLRTIHGQLEGGSTLTMQLAKMMKGDSARTLRRKLDDMALSLAMEQHLSKAEILRLYADHAYFGHNVYGLNNACRYYFGRHDCVDLSLAEGAYLVGLVKAPTKYGNDIALGIQRRNIVLTVAMGMSDPPQNVGPVAFLSWYVHGGFREVFERELFHQNDLRNRYGARALKEAIASPLVIKGEPELSSSPYVRDTALGLVRERMGEDVLARGANVVLTIDSNAQKLAERALSHALEQAEEAPNMPKDLDGGAIVLNGKTGQVLALVGGRDYELSQVPFALRPIQVGSSIKPFVYAEGFERGVLKRGQKVVDHAVCIDHWCPKNYGNKYYGELAVEDALAHSLNSVAVRTAQSVTVEALLSRFRLLGINSPLTPNLTLALGTSEVTMLELATAYTALVDGSVKSATMISHADDRHGHEIYAEPKPTPIQVYWPESVAAVREGMRRVLLPGGTGVRLGQALTEAWKGRAAPEVICKTGTTNDAVRVGMVCVLSDSDYHAPLVVAVFLGARVPTSLGSAATGGHIAGPAMQDLVLGLARRGRHYQTFVAQNKVGPYSTPPLAPVVAKNTPMKVSQPIVYEAAGERYLYDLHQMSLPANVWAQLEQPLALTKETHERFHETLRGEDWKHGNVFERALSLAGKLARFVVVRGFNNRAADQTLVIEEPHSYVVVQNEPDRTVTTRIKGREDIVNIRLFVADDQLTGLDLITATNVGESYAWIDNHLRRLEASRVVVEHGALSTAWKKSGLDDQKLNDLRQLVSGTSVQLDAVRRGFDIDLLESGHQLIAAHIKSPTYNGDIEELKLARVDGGVFGSDGEAFGRRLWPISAKGVETLSSKAAVAGSSKGKVNHRNVVSEAIFKTIGENAVVLPTRARVVSANRFSHSLTLVTAGSARLELSGIISSAEAGDVFAAGDSVGVVDPRGYLAIHASEGIDQIVSQLHSERSPAAALAVDQLERQLDFVLRGPRRSTGSPTWAALTAKMDNLQ